MMVMLLTAECFAMECVAICWASFLRGRDEELFVTPYCKHPPSHVMTLEGAKEDDSSAVITIVAIYMEGDSQRVSVEILHLSSQLEAWRVVSIDVSPCILASHH